MVGKVALRLAHLKKICESERKEVDSKEVEDGYQVEEE